tara:strand:- start:1581 stop:2141 length:561 start_codon:yes stop_codon:yes gene_type:complete
MTHTISFVPDHLGFTGPKALGHEYYVDAIVDITDLDDALTMTGAFTASANTFVRASGAAIAGLAVGNSVAITNAVDGGNNIETRITAIDGNTITFTTIGADEASDEVTLSKLNVVIPYSDFGLSTVSQVLVCGCENVELNPKVELGTDGNSLVAGSLVLRPVDENSGYTLPSNDAGTIRLRLFGKL